MADFEFAQVSPRRLQRYARRMGSDPSAWRSCALAGAAEHGDYDMACEVFISAFFSEGSPLSEYAPRVTWRLFYGQMGDRRTCTAKCPRLRKQRAVIRAAEVALGLNGKELAELFDVSEGRVSRARKKSAPKPTRYGQLLIEGMTPQRAARPLSSRYGRIINRWRTDAESYLAASLSALNDAYAADAYISGVGTYRKERKSFYRNIAQHALKRLKAVTRPRITEDMLEKFVADSLFVCRLGGAYKQARAKVAQAVRRRDAIASLASTKPWYPKVGTSPAMGSPIAGSAQVSSSASCTARRVGGWKWLLATGASQAASPIATTYKTG